MYFILYFKDFALNAIYLCCYEGFHIQYRYLQDYSIQIFDKSVSRKHSFLKISTAFADEMLNGNLTWRLRPFRPDDNPVNSSRLSLKKI